MRHIHVNLFNTCLSRYNRSIPFEGMYTICCTPSVKVKLFDEIFHTNKIATNKTEGPLMLFTVELVGKYTFFLYNMST